jgi:hypothetical protein
MSTPFSRTTRSLSADRSSQPLIWILVLVLLLAIWLLWFFLVPIDISKSSVSARLSNETEIEAIFPTEALGIVRPGQATVIRLAGFPWTQYGTLAGTVSDAGLDSNGRLLVKVEVPSTSESLIPRHTGLAGSVEIIVDRVTPAILLLRALGQSPATAQPSPENRALGELHP